MAVILRSAALICVPAAEAPATKTSAMKPTSNPYSMAVAPLESRQNWLTWLTRTPALSAQAATRS